MIAIIKKAHEKNWEIGKDIGIISYDDTPTKEILCGGITVLSPNFQAMGKTVGVMIKTGILEKSYNPFNLFVRSSL